MLVLTKCNDICCIHLTTCVLPWVLTKYIKSVFQTSIPYHFLPFFLILYFPSISHILPHSFLHFRHPFFISYSPKFSAPSDKLSLHVWVKSSTLPSRAEPEFVRLGGGVLWRRTLTWERLRWRSNSWSRYIGTSYPWYWRDSVHTLQCGCYMTQTWDYPRVTLIMRSLITVTRNDLHLTEHLLIHVKHVPRYWTDSQLGLHELV